MADLHPGDVFAGHRIEGLAGRGGMGVVYRATELTLDRVVALKLIAPALAGDPDFRARFLRESRAAASIEHPNVLPIYYAGERDDELYIVMRYVDGQDLRTLVRASGRLPAPRVANMVAQVGAALDAAHERGPRAPRRQAGQRAARRRRPRLPHRLRAREAHGVARPRSAGPAAGSGRSGYVAPEQIRGERVDARTDVYALGCVLVHALSGKPPYVRDSEEATLWAHLQRARRPVRAEGVPEAFAGVVARALAKDPAERYPSAGDLGPRGARGRRARSPRRGRSAPWRAATRRRRSIAASAATTRVSPGPDAQTAVAPTARCCRRAGSAACSACFPRWERSPSSPPRSWPGSSCWATTGAVDARPRGGCGDRRPRSPSPTAPAPTRCRAPDRAGRRRRLVWTTSYRSRRAVRHRRQDHAPQAVVGAHPHRHDRHHRRRRHALARLRAVQHADAPRRAHRTGERGAEGAAARQPVRGRRRRRRRVDRQPREPQPQPDPAGAAGRQAHGRGRRRSRSRAGSSTSP